MSFHGGGTYLERGEAFIGGVVRGGGGCANLVSRRWGATPQHPRPTRSFPHANFWGCFSPQNIMFDILSFLPPFVVELLLSTFHAFRLNCPPYSPARTALHLPNTIPFSPSQPLFSPGWRDSKMWRWGCASSLPSTFIRPTLLEEIVVPSCGRHQKATSYSYLLGTCEPSQRSRGHRKLIAGI